MRWEATLDVLEGRVLDSPDLECSLDHSQCLDVLGAYGLTSLGRKATMDEWAMAVRQRCDDGRMDELACGFEGVIEFDNAVRRGRDAKQALIMANLRLVVSIAKQWRHYSGSFTFLDLIQEGTFGLVKAIEKFDPEKGFRFATYATPLIQQALKTGIENKAHMVRLPMRMHRELRLLGKAFTEISTRTGRQATDGELMERLQITKEKLANLLIQRSTGLALSVDAFEFDPAWKPVNGVQPLPGRIDSMESEVDAWLQTLPSEDINLLQLRFGLGGAEAMSYREIADRLGISTGQAANWVKKVLTKMRGDNKYQELRKFIV
jgi:RNA polymerase sigma factor (sigma-70 family)